MPVNAAYYVMFTLQGGASWSTVNDLFHAGHRQSFVFWGESVYLSIHTYNIKSPYYDRKVFFYNILHKFSSRNFRSWLFDVVILVNWLRSNKLPCFHLYLLSPYQQKNNFLTWTIMWRFPPCYVEKTKDNNNKAINRQYKKSKFWILKSGVWIVTFNIN